MTRSALPYLAISRTSVEFTNEWVDAQGRLMRTGFWESEDAKNMYTTCPNVPEYQEAMVAWVRKLLELGADPLVPNFNNTTPVSDQYLYSIDNTWKVEGVGDFDNDGHPDFFFRNVASGLGFVWYWNGSALGASNFLFSIDPVWEVVQLADWNRDGQPDLLFRNRDTGVVFVWYLNGTALAGSDFVIQIDPSWEIVPRH